MGLGVRIPLRAAAGMGPEILRHCAGWRIRFVCWILDFLARWFYVLARLGVPAVFWRLILLRSGCGYE